MDIMSLLYLLYYVTVPMSGYHWDFDNILNGEKRITYSDISKLKPGDLILRVAEDKVGKLFYHAGVYTEDNEVIHFTFETYEDQSKFSWSASSKGKSIISKQGVMGFIYNHTYCVLRLKPGIPKDFKERVKREMNSFFEEYHLWTNNCLHFALRLLGVLQKDNHSSMDWKAKNIIEEYMKSAPYNIWPWTWISPLIMNRVHSGGVYNMKTQTTSISAFMNRLT